MRVTFPWYRHQLFITIITTSCATRNKHYNKIRDMIYNIISVLSYTLYSIALVPCSFFASSQSTPTRRTTTNFSSFFSYDASIMMLNDEVKRDVFKHPRHRKNYTNNLILLLYNLQIFYES